MNSEEEREKAAVYMEGLAEMRADWAREGAGRGKPRPPGQKGSKSGQQKGNRRDKKDPRRGG
jgi:hypothetical protein